MSAGRVVKRRKPEDLKSSRQNSCEHGLPRYILDNHGVRLADRVAGGPMAHFLFWPAGSEGKANSGSAALIHPGNFGLGGVGVLGRHQPHRASDRAVARGDGLSSRSGGHHQRPPADAPGHGRAARRPADDGRGLRADQPLGLRHSRCRRSDRRRLHARDQLAGDRSSAGSREDYDRFSGFEARIELARPIEGRKRFRGRLLGTSAESVRLATETGEVRSAARRRRASKTRPHR